MKKLLFACWLCLVVLIASVGSAGAAPPLVSAAVRQSSAFLAVQQAHLVAADPSTQAFFGDSVAISGNTLVVGAPNGVPETQSGAVYVFVRSGTTWRLQAKLADGVADDEFGSCVAISGDTVVVGAPDGAAGQRPPGAAYVFVRNGTAWSQQAKLTAADGVGFDRFGSSVGVWGDTAAVGAPMHSGANLEQGAVYVFVRSANAWSQQAELTAADAATYDSLGESIAVSRDTLVAGASNHKVGANTEEGAAYVFARNGDTWSQQAELTAADGRAADMFGSAVAICQDTAVVASYSHQVGAPTDTGVACVFARTGSTWAQQAELTASDSASMDEFGRSVAISGHTVVVGAPYHAFGRYGGEGVTYVFTAAGTTWSQRAELTVAEASAGEYLGGSIAISGDTCVEGDPHQWVKGHAAAGGAYVFTASDPGTPYLTSAYPWHGVPAAAVTITGSHFGASQGTGTVTFGGSVAAVSSWSDDAICCSIPNGLVPGEADVVVTTPQGASDPQAFTVDAAVLGQPVISSITPPRALRGADVTITGTDFGAVQGASTVTVGGTGASVSDWSDTVITCSVPAGLPSGAADVIVHTAVDSNVALFIVDAVPSISKVTPGRGKVGITLTITGKDFGAEREAAKVLFGSKAATKYLSWSATRIKVRVPTISKGRKAIRVVTATGKSNAKYFTRL